MKKHGIYCEDSIAKECTAFIISAGKNAFNKETTRFVLLDFSVYYIVSDSGKKLHRYL